MNNSRVRAWNVHCGWISPLTLMLVACDRLDHPPERRVPPVVDTGIVARVLRVDAPPGPWRMVSTPHFRLHVRAGSESARLISKLGDSAESARRTVLRRFAIDESAQAAPVDLIFADTRAEMALLIGRPTAGFVPRGTRAAFLLAGATYRPLFRHELTHVYTIAAWGEPSASGVWLSEGLATLATGDCTGVSVDSRAADLGRREALVPIAEMVRDFASLPEPVAYGEAASILGFVLRSESTLATVRALWQSSVRGTASPAQHPLGPNGVRLERAWLRSLTHVIPTAIDTLAILRYGC